MFIPTFDQFYDLTEYCSQCNERIEAPYVRFMLNYESVKQISKRLTCTEKRVLELAQAWNNYYIINYNGNKIQIYRISTSELDYEC